MKPRSIREKAIVVVVVLAAACYAGPRARAVPSPCDSACVACSGESYLAIDNQTGSAIEIYANIDAGPPRYIGWVGDTADRLSLVGTALEHRAGTVYARVRGNAPPVPLNPRNSARDGTVTLSRRCEKPRG